MLKHIAHSFFSSISEDSFGALLTEGEHPSPFLLFHPRSQAEDYRQFDVEFYQVCCLDAQLCDMFHERRPSDTCLATPIATSSQVSRRKRFIFFVVVFIYVPPFWSKCLKCNVFNPSLSIPKVGSGVIHTSTLSMVECTPSMDVESTLLSRWRDFSNSRLAHSQ